MSMPVAELPFGIVIDFSFWNQILNLPTNQMVSAIFAIVGWTIVALIFFFMGAELWVSIRQTKNTINWQWTLLAVDVPPDTIQGPKAVEQIFSQLSGAHSGPNIGEKYWQGAKQRWFSLEIISLEGYIQFLVYTEAKFRDLVEAAVYAQYPMAEITEVEDYVSAIPDKYPNETHNMFGIEFGLAEEDAYPIRTYPDFEQKPSPDPDITLYDPMAAILENFTRIGVGENLWLQIILEPVSGKWKEKGIGLVKSSLQAKGSKLVKSLIENKKPTAKQPFIMQLLNGLFTELLNVINPPAEAPKKKEEKKDAAGKITDLSPGVRDTIVSIEKKIAKIGFKTKIRILYAAENSVFNPSRCLEGFTGAMNQFSYPGRNALVPKLLTSAHYGFKNYRLAEIKRKFVTAYKKRKIKIGKNPYILNIEELATLWHFPLPLVKPPLLQKTASKRAEPPINLPIEEMTGSPLKRRVQKVAEEPEEETPTVLPYA